MIVGVLLGVSVIVAVGSLVAAFSALLLLPLLRTALFRSFGGAVLSVLGRPSGAAAGRWTTVATVGGLVALWLPLYAVVGGLAVVADRPQWLAELDFLIPPIQWGILTLVPVFVLRAAGEPWVSTAADGYGFVGGFARWTAAMFLYLLVEVIVGLGLAFAGDALFT